MANELTGKKVAILATDGVEQIELVKPMEAAKDAGATVHLISLKPGVVKGFNHFDPGDTFNVDRSTSEAKASDYDALILPGGVGNPDTLRMHPDAVSFVRDFFAAGKPVAVICHGPWTMIEADVVRGRTLTSWPSLQTDIRNAGGTWVDEEVHVDSGTNHLVSSRRPEDLPAFCTALVQAFSQTTPNA